MSTPILAPDPPTPRTAFARHLPVAAIGAALYLLLWPIMTSDVEGSFTPWLEHIAGLGPARAFSSPFGDYAPPYLYLLTLASPLVGIVPSDTIVKLVSLSGTLLMAGAVWRLLRAMNAPHPERHALYALLLPGVLMNTALMAQCDALYAAPTVMAVAAAWQHRHRSMFLWCGLAVAVKLQAILIAPFFLAVAIQRRVPLHWWLLAPAALALANLPAALAGWPVGDLAMVYFRRTTFYPELSRNAPNIWAILQAMPGLDVVVAARIANIAAIVVSVAYVSWVVRRPIEGRRMLAAAALAPMLTAGLLPHMHERFFYVSDVLIFVWAIVGSGRDRWTAALVQAGSFLGIMAYGNGTEQLAMLGALAMLEATRQIVRSLASESLPFQRVGRWVGV